MPAPPVQSEVRQNVIGRGSSRLGGLLIALGGLVLAGYGLYVSASLVNTIVLTLVLALTVSPILFGLQRRGWPTWACVIGAFLVVFGITLAFIFIALVSISHLDDNLPYYQQRLTEIVASVAARFGLDNPPVVDVSDVPADMAQRFVRYLVPFAFGIVGLIGSLVLYMFLLLYAFGEVFVVPDRLRHLTAGHPMQLELLRRFGNDMRSWFKLNAMMGAIAAAIDTVVLLMIGVDFALLWGLISFLFSFIPNIGFILSMVGPTLLALIQFGWEAAVLVIVAYCLINLIIDYALRPRIISQDLNQSQIITFMAVVVWGTLLGPTGALLSVPLTLIVKLILEIVTESTRVTGLIMEEIPTEADGDSPTLVREPPAPVTSG